MLVYFLAWNHLNIPHFNLTSLRFTFLPIWAFISPAITRILCFRMLRTKENVHIITQFHCQAIQFSQTVLIQTTQFRISRVFVYTLLNMKKTSLSNHLFKRKSSVKVKKSYFSNNPIYHAKTVQFQTIRFSISTQFKYQNSSISNNSVYHKFRFIRPIDRTLSSVTTPSWSGPGSDGSKVVLCIPLILTGVSTSYF